MTASVDVETKIDHNYHQLPSERVNEWERALPAAYFEYRRKWEEYPKQRIVKAFPVHLDIEATSHCNLKCVMCPRTEMIEEGTFWKVQHFDMDLYRRLVEEGREKDLCSIKFNYLGEPLLNPRLVEMILFAKENGVVDVMFNTNAAALTERTARELIDSGLDKLFFSFDSPYREHYNKIRVNADYDKVLQNIKNFMRFRAEMNSLKPFTRVSMVRMKENEEEWRVFQKLFEPIVDAVAWVDYIEHSNAAGSGKGKMRDSSTVESRIAFCCPQLWQRMFVHPDGVVTVCCVDSARKLQVGSIHNKTVEEIWTGPAYQKLRDLHAAGRIHEIPVCANCHLARTP